ncbi:DEAD/DEAH box helicase [Succinivibrio dextrinosolvens]|uniref:ATP-dependent RNA helicase SrmB n=1 Tax=Succinivibrio dextrinosolvens TaxID=83771 RepID=A0A662ZBU0_9GAMM|nr:DEAD/DEAH box helicase [Succinivibrio dextrinosolvens]SFK16731.1 ATP-dependent RNA helicase SrmB [Succinivibrio dextrinosolvens]
MLFSELGLPEFLVENINKLGWKTPTPVQTLVLPKAMEGFDILGGAPTGTGKSAAFLLPIIARLSLEKKSGIRAIILEPTRELAMQVESVCSELIGGFNNLSAGTIIGGGSREVQRENPSSIIAATPGRLIEYIEKGWIDTSSVEMFVIDEADRMLDMGFRDDVAKITRELYNRYQTLLFSATLEGAGIEEFASSVLNDPIEVRLGAGGEEDEVLPEFLQSRAYYAAGDPQKIRILHHLLTTIKGKSIVFVKTKERLQRLDASLRRLGFKCASIQGDLSMSERKAALKNFSAGDKDILIATDVAARGLDLPDVTHVYNFDMPANAAIYVHRAGRTARAGEKGVVTTLVMANEITFLEKIERYTGKDIEKRAIKNVCAEFPTEKTLGHHQSEKKRSRASVGGNGGFDKKKKEEDKKTHKKNRLRDKKNKGKPDFAAKRAKKAARARSE